LIVSVRDHGRGLAPGAQPRIGLSNTQSRLEHLHGRNARVDIANAPGGGTAVTIRLPFHTASDTASPDPASTNPAPANPAPASPAPATSAPANSATAQPTTAHGHTEAIGRS